MRTCLSRSRGHMSQLAFFLVDTFPTTKSVSSSTSREQSHGHAPVHARPRKQPRQGEGDYIPSHLPVSSQNTQNATLSRVRTSAKQGSLR